ncbi:MAG: hypothetical protein H0V91_05185 [Flavisolibacter sp.]|nr:hypothetical protein [Flavisolibacter sp.]
MKNPFVIEVSFDGENVRVVPIKKTKEGIIYRTIARCEEYLAQLFLKEQQPNNIISGLAGYFKQRGWSISY